MHPKIKFHPRFIATTIAFSFFLMSTAAQAQRWNNPEQPQERKAAEDHFIIGAGAGYAPAYQGADDYIVLPIPVVDVAWGPLYANLRNGIGLNVIDSDVVTIGGGVSFQPGYRAKDVPVGIGRLSVGLGGRGFASVKAGGFVATVGATQGFTGGTKGFVADASLSYPIPVSSRAMVIPTIGATWADRKHNDRYFGVTTVQSLASGLPAFDAGSGFKDASAMLTVSYRLTDRINLGVTGGVTTLLGDMKDSPLVYHKTQPSGFLTLSYRFGS